VSPSPRRAVIEHDARLDILCCLAGGEPLALAQVSGRTGMHPTRATHHMRILDAFGLVGKRRDGECGQVLYVARLDEHPAWVAEAVEAYRSG
jgi:DNA-binding transcriptional ArsR family regulator